MKRLYLRLSYLALASFLCFPQAAGAGKMNIVEASSSIYFRLDNLVSFSSGFIRSFDGTVRMNKDKLKGIEINADTGSLTTFFEARDEFLKSRAFFDVEQFSSMSLKSKKINEMQVLADLTFKGVTKPLVLNYTVLRQGKDDKGKERVSLALSGLIDRREFGIDYNRNSENGDPVLSNYIQLVINVEGAAK